MTDVELMRDARDALALIYLLVAHPVKDGRGLTRTPSEIIQQAHDAIAKLEERLLRE
ncbi:hypothetical protein LCGC14_0676830 [marine sediment metagenome]|uniref:Uncharacterized protein n=1 Tax=marine sediment metagenome TaxID=412755 RepID=A0A0F9QUD9_9ZZZZ